MTEGINLEQALEFAITTEEIGEKFYTRLAKHFEKNDELREIFTTLAHDEKAHRKRFAALRAQVAMKDMPAQYEQQQYLRAISISEIFSKVKRMTNSIDAIHAREDALEYALALEKSTLLYYDALRDIMGEHNILNAIIAEEKRHIVNVMKYLMTEAKVRGLTDNY